MAHTIRTIPEPNKTVDVVRECDVVVVGGGPGGIGAAVSAARNGADTVLIERYGHLGGMGTGGLVTIIPCLSDFERRHADRRHQPGMDRKIDRPGGRDPSARRKSGAPPTSD